MPEFTNPADLHDPTAFGYSHSVRVPAGGDLVWVAGQYASGPDGRVVSGDFKEQVKTSLSNLGIALAAHGLDFTDVIQLRTYIVQPDFDRLGALSEAVASRFQTPPVNTLLGVAALAMPDMLFEVEAVALRP
ncbi:MAG: RidA family protein [Myxococcota bacterium]